MRKWTRVILSVALLGSFLQAHAMAYVDPAGASTLMRVLAPVFILVSALGFQFKHRLGELLRRAFHRRKPEAGAKP